jgi:hypothetical protein
MVGLLPLMAGENLEDFGTDVEQTRFSPFESLVLLS